MKVALVHDWLVEYGGAERVLRALLKIFPTAHIFTLVDKMPNPKRAFLEGHPIKTSFIDRLPFSRRLYRSYLPLMPYAAESFDLSSFDLIVSSHHAVAKGVIVSPDQKHICYCHSPMRYAWDLQHEYLTSKGIARGLRSVIARKILHKMRMWDMRHESVDHFIAVSNFIQRRIHRVYRRDSFVIHPPVDVDCFSAEDKKSDFYLTASRMVPYKRIDLIVKAFSRMPSRRLVVIGDGPEFKKIRRYAACQNVELMGFQSTEVLKTYMQKAKAFIFAAREDFGIIPLEAQACGTPVIGFGQGGLLDTVIPGKTGLFFGEQTEESLIQAVEQFEENAWSSGDCRENAERFSEERFISQMKEYTELVWGEKIEAQAHCSKV